MGKGKRNDQEGMQDYKHTTSVACWPPPSLRHGVTGPDGLGKIGRNRARLPRRIASDTEVKLLKNALVLAVQAAAVLFRAERLVDADVDPGIFVVAEEGFLLAPAFGVLGAAFAGWTVDLLSTASALSELTVGTDG